MYTIFKIRSPGIYRPIVLSVLSIVWMLTASACTQNVPTPPPALPTRHVEVTKFPTPTLLIGYEEYPSLAVGRIIYEDGCLILEEGPHTRRTLVWPKGRRVDINQDEGTVTFFNPDGSIVRVLLGKQKVNVGGGPAPDGFPQVQPFSKKREYVGIDDCPLPYWLTASVKLYVTPTPVDQ